ncbi:DUF4013 domain-containing protein [Halopelagius longus]|uniref:DUF4013 domain-containing protein n=1 Tax=Halopelagius longus TaxID=1236180 RepID=A0A1H1DDX1_9EURY|nr:DUF4013 domain-containing protein [Halopelagius longus]RDI71292.1 DUF4013 domain-containing protein [Halopelagius longus]SDQ74703.1 Protein of unknown function [Halopelagius longus]
MRHTLDVAMESLSTAERRTETVIVGSLLTLGSAIAPVLWIPLVGYAVRAVRSAAESETALPTFEGWDGLLLDGGRATLAAVPLHLPGLVVLRFAVGFDRARLTAPYLFSDLRRGVLPGLDLFVGLLAVVALEIAAGYLSLAVLVAVARRGSLGPGLVATTSEIARDGAFARTSSLAVAVGTVGHVLGGVVAAVPILGGPASAAVSFLAVAVGASVLGGRLSPRGDDDRRDGDVRSPTASSASSASPAPNRGVRD